MKVLSVVVGIDVIPSTIEHPKVDLGVSVLHSISNAKLLGVLWFVPVL